MKPVNGNPRPRHSAGELYVKHFHGGRRERHFLASVAFFVAFFVIRAITHAIHAGRGPFHNLVTTNGLHIHHLVYGIILLLTVGYLWLAQVGTGAAGSSIWTSRLTSILYGMGAALTLDEFALWLRLEDVYWAHEGRESVDAVILFGALLSAGWWGRLFLTELAKEFGRALGRRAK